MTDRFSKKFLYTLLWFAGGVIVGFGAILPGISGGTLCVVFGMYRPAIEMISNPLGGMKKHGQMLGTFLVGVTVGFVGLSGVAAWFLEKNTMLVTCAFIGFIIGTFPELWRDAGTEGRNRNSYIAAAAAFLIMLTVLTIFKSTFSVTIAPGVTGYLICGLLWGLSFIVPGLSSSSLLLFFGLYQPMLAGISAFHLNVLIPMGIGMSVCVILLSKVVGFAYQKYFSVVSHGVIGIVAATAVMIFPVWDGSVRTAVLSLLFIFAGANLSLCFSNICDRMKTNGRSV